MRLVLQQVFPLGRFHATPWRVNPFDDPLGEWPPSPWRLVRAIVARWYQWRREKGGGEDGAELERLIQVLCGSAYRFYLPSQARRGTPLRQYYPVEFRKNPPAKKKAGMLSYATSLAQDNYWCVSRDETGSVWWFIESDEWTPQLIEILDRCLERVTYFGRAESFTTIHRAEGAVPGPNCELGAGPRSPRSVRVLAPERGATRADVERVTDDPAMAKRTVPPGARVMYADPPAPPPIRDGTVRPLLRKACSLMQLAIGWHVSPEPPAIVRLTSRFRGAVLRELLHIKTDGRCVTWKEAPTNVLAAVADMAGKDPGNKPLQGHRHAEFLAWWENGLPTRLLVWRAGRAFDEDEQVAILRAAKREVSWAAAGGDASEWKVRLVPLDMAVPPPPGFDGARACTWESLTPYVPPRHHLRGGKPRALEAIPLQVRRELLDRGVPGSDEVQVAEFGQPEWVAVHVPRRRGAPRPFLGNRRGYRLRLTFPEPVAGPVRLGHSSSFGLGLFRPMG